MIEDFLTDAKKVLQAYNKMESYRIQEHVLQHLLIEYPDHNNKAAVEVKIKLLNLFYSTYILATNRMVEHILFIHEHEDIDKCLRAGDISLVNKIASLSINEKDFDFYSFATKYCAYHNPGAFPIYDNIVANVFLRIFEDGNFNPFYVYTRKQNSRAENEYNKKQFAAKLRNYSFYVDVYNTFMKEYGLWGRLTYREVDAYIWGAYKIAGSEYEIERFAPIDKSKIMEIKI